MSFPLNNNDPYIKSTGERSTLGAELAKGGTSELPEYGLVDAGKVLTVGDDGELEWDTKGTGGGDVLEGYSATYTSGSGSHTYTKSITIPKTGSYYLFIGGYLESLTVEINDVEQEHYYDQNSDYIHIYYAPEKTLQANDVVDVSIASSGGSAIFSTIIEVNPSTP